MVNNEHKKGPANTKLHKRLVFRPKGKNPCLKPSVGGKRRLA